MVEALAKATDVPLDAHLMIEDADRNALAYVEAGCGSVTFHVEADEGAGPAGPRDPRPRRPRGHGAEAGHARSSPTRTCSPSSTWCW